MVTFHRLPYATAFERGQVQRELLVELTRGHARWTRSTGDGRRAVRERLSPLPAELSRDRRSAADRLAHESRVRFAC